jgi:predicted RNA polymerase sigma factor
MLAQISDNPMVALNHAIATAMVHGPNAGLELLKPLDADERLAGSHRLDAVRAHLLERGGECEGAVALYRAAAAKAKTIPERNYLVMRAGRLSDVRKGGKALAGQDGT